MSIDFESLKSINVNEPVSAALVSKEESDRFISEVAKTAGISNNQAFVALAIISQKGGTSKKAQGTVYAIVDGIRVDLNQVRKILKERGMTFTIRQWARTNAMDIFKVCSHYGIEGDLAKKIGRNDASITSEERIWMSNFQMDNPDCPDNVRNMLMRHYNSLFPGRSIISD